MKTKTFKKTTLHISGDAEDDKNIGVLQVDLPTSAETHTIHESRIKGIVEPLVVKILTSHYNCPVKVVSVEVYGPISKAPVSLFFNVLVEATEEDRNESIFVDTIPFYTEADLK